MPFPLSIEGRLQIARGDAEDDLRERVLQRAKSALREISDNVAIRGEQLVSRRRLQDFWIVTGGHPLAFVDRVIITVTEDGNSTEVNYTLGMTSVCYLVAASVLGMLLCAFISGLGRTSPMDTAWLVVAFFVGWGWLFGMTYFLAWARASAWLMRKLAQPA